MKSKRKEKETEGTRIAREIRAECNSLTTSQRVALAEKAMKLIYGGEEKTLKS